MQVTMQQIDTALYRQKLRRDDVKNPPVINEDTIMETKNTFTELYQRDVSKYIEKKGRFSYLSWTYAVAELSKIDPDASWKVVRFNGLPYLESSCGFFVEVEVTVNGKMRSQIHPVLDNNNKPIAQPNSFQINTSIQRCLVKAIALQGLGLSIFSGEDVPEQPPVDNAKVIANFAAALESAADLEHLVQLWNTIPKPLHLALVKVKDGMKQKLTQQAA